MPDFNRRGFLQVLSAAGLAPLVPALPVLPARAVSVPVGASHAKALWSGIYAKSGSVPKFVSVAQNMGLSNAAVQGVSARSVGVRVAVATAANPAARVAGSAKAAAPFRSERLKAVRDVEALVLGETDEGADNHGAQDALEGKPVMRADESLLGSERF